TSLFARPSYGHYYFGDYYSGDYLNNGFYPWFDYGRRHHDPMFGYYGWRHRGDPNWYRGLDADYRARRDGHLARPPRTLRDQQTRVQNLRNNPGDHNARLGTQIVRPLNQVEPKGRRLTRLNANDGRAADRNAAAIRARGAERQRLENPSSVRQN